MERSTNEEIKKNKIRKQRQKYVETKCEKISLTFPRRENFNKDVIREIAERNGMTMSGYIIWLIKKENGIL